MLARMQLDQLKRREFIAVVGGAAAAWPLAARGQQPAMPVIGFLSGASPDAFPERMRGLRQGLKETGFIRGRWRGEGAWGMYLAPATPTREGAPVRG